VPPRSGPGGGPTPELFRGRTNPDLGPSTPTWVDLQFSAAGPSWAARPTEGWQQSLAAKPGRSPLRAGGAGSGASKQSAPSSLRGPAPPPRDRGPRLRRHGTAVPLRLSLAASSRFAPSTAPPLLRRCGAGLAHTSITEQPCRPLPRRGHAKKHVAHFVRGT